MGLRTFRVARHFLCLLVNCNFLYSESVPLMSLYRFRKLESQPNEGLYHAHEV